jgi:RNA polymerase sigma-70 factor (ECF subfamily)
VGAAYSMRDRNGEAHRPEAVRRSPAGAVRLLPRRETDRQRDHRLFARMADGDQDVLRILLAEHRHRALSAARRILSDWGDAQDVMQETFIELWQRAGDFESHRGSAAGWITTIARSRAIDRRRARIRAGRALEMAVLDLRPATMATPDEVEDFRRERESLRQALNALSPTHRFAVVAAYFDELTQAEVAAKTGTPLGTVKLQRRTALAALSRLVRAARRSGAIGRRD